MFMKYFRAKRLRMKCLQMVASPHTSAAVRVREAQILVDFITRKER